MSLERIESVHAFRRRFRPSTVIDLLRESALQQPNSTAYTFLTDGQTEESLTYRELDRRARGIAAQLQTAIGEGQRVLLLYPPGLEYIVAFWGCIYAGVVAVPAYPPRPHRGLLRLQAIAADAQAVAALTTSAILSKLQPIPAEMKALTALRWMISSGDTDKLADQWLEPDIDADALAFLQYTSGSTAAPKGVMVTHANLLHNEEMIRRVFRQTNQSVIVGWLPLYHDMGLIGNVLQPLYVGARCILLSPAAFLQQPYRWLEAISRYRATTSGGPNFAYDLCVDKISAEERATLDLSSWTTAFNGAEPIRAETLERFADAFGVCGFRKEAFHPCYGLAEGTLLVSGSLRPRLPMVQAVEPKALERNLVIESSPGVAGVRLLVGCGNTLADQRIVVVNPESRTECLRDEIGEILVSGPSVAAGYWNQPEATAEIFHARVANRDDDTQFLCTGDLGFVKDGELFITGRLKDLIIIRGRNHYPQDIERTMESSHISLRHGCGAAFSVEVCGEERLVVVQELKQHRAGDADEAMAGIRAAIAEEHEIAPYAVVLIKTATIPKTSSGKIRRGACRDEFLGQRLKVIAEWRENARNESAQELAETTIKPPRSAAEVEGWLKAQLGLSVGTNPGEIDVQRPIASYGLDSLAAVSLAHRIDHDLGIEFPFADLLQDTSITQLAAVLRQRLEMCAQIAPVSVATAPPPREAIAEYGLTRGQQSLWFLHQMAPESTAYHLVSAVQVLSELDVPALRRCFQALVDRHPALRTTFIATHGKPVQRLHDRMDVCFEEENAEGWSESELDSRLLRSAHRPFDLEHGPLMRVSLFKRSSQDHVLLLALHHIVADFWSLAVMIQELGTLYSAELRGGTAGFASLTSQYTDFARWQNELLESPEGERHWSYWKKQFAVEPPPLNLPLDYLRPPVQTFRGASHCFKLSAELTSGLKNLSRAHGDTLYMTLLAVFQILLQRYTGQSDISVGTPTSGRARSSWAGLVGYFVNPVVMCADLSGDPTFTALLERTRETALAAFEHQDYPFALLVERLQPTRDPSRSPLFQVMFVLQKAHLSEAESVALLALGEAGARIKLGPLALESRPLEQRVAQFDLTLAVTETSNGLIASLEYNTSLFKQETIERLAAHYVRLAESATRNPACRISQLEMLAEDERHHLLVELNETQHDYPSGESPHELFEEQVRRNPKAIAVKRGDEQITYAELNQRANQLARRLLSLGVGPESCVALLLERSFALITGALAALKAGAAYVPLDPAYPIERLRYMVRDAHANVLLTHSQFSDAMADCDCEVVCMDSATNFESEAADDLRLQAGSQSLAYVIYTSGSTGVPKGVAIQRDTLMNLVRWHQRTYDVLPTDRATLIAGTGFDASVWELWPYLAAGACLHIPDEEARTSPAKLVAWLTAEQINVCFLPTPLAEAVLDQEWPAASSLRLLLTGGDKLRRWLHKPFPFRLINHYGPTENTVVTTAIEVGAPKQTHLLPPIGRPIDNTRVYLLSTGLQPVPLGVTGELYISGDSLARGYLGRPDATAERFIPDPFSPEPGARMYRTGDLAGYLSAGEIEYRGRIDQQVKLRGFRVELGEIEAVLSGHPLVRECVVVAVEQLSGEIRLAAYVTARSREIPSAAEMRDFLVKKLPEYMLPYAFIILDALPLTPNGKVDLRALPAPSPDDSASNYIGARTPTQEVLVGIWGALLGVERVGINDNFFALGGHSLLAAQLISRVRASFNVDLPLHSVFTSPTPQLLADQIETAARTALGVSVPAIQRVARTGRTPLSFAQRRLWFLNQFETESTHYNIAAMVRLSGRLNALALERSLRELMRRHETLRTSFVVNGEEPIQEIAESFEMTLPTVNLEAWEESEREPEAGRLAAREAGHVFDLGHGPLVRFMLLRLSEHEHMLILTMHHIISDGWSMGVLIRELTVLYDCFLRGAASPLAELPVQYADFAHWQQRWLKGEVLGDTVRYWQQQLSGMSPALHLPTDYARPDRQTFHGARVPLSLDKNLTDSLQALSRAHDATLFMTLLAAFQVLLMRYSGETDINVGAPAAGRTRAETEGLIGFFVNTLVLRADLSGDPTFAELLARTREVCLGAYQHQELPFEQLVEVVRPGRELNRTPLFQVMLVLQNSPLPAIELDGLRAEVIEIETQTTKFEMTLTLRAETDGTLVGSFNYQTDLFSRETVERFASQYRRLLESVTAAPGRRISKLNLLGEEERRHLLVGLNQTAHEYPETCVHKLFEEQVERTPDAVAVVFEDHKVTYAELNRLADQLACQLRCFGVGAEVLVGVMMERSVELTVALLAIHKAGGAYVPLDPSYPLERIAFMLNDAQARLLLTQSVLGETLTGIDVPIVYVDQAISADSQSAVSADDTTLAATPDNLAYMIYTSGSTGTPKGVCVSHRSLVNYICGVTEALGLSGGLSFAMVSTPAADLGNTVLFPSLCTGGCLHLISRERAADAAAMAAYCEQHAVDCLKIVPSHLSALLADEDARKILPRRCLVLGGEESSWSLIDRVHSLSPDCAVFNHYGPTETTVGVLTYAIRNGAQQQRARRVPLGRPLPNIKVYILDKFFNLAPMGVIGELYIAGQALARGYHARPASTAEKFIPDPFSDKAGGRLYRTGDLARYFGNGEIEFLGRADNQVKVRGYRIELGEIETALRGHPLVHDAILLACEEMPNEVSLAAYVVAKPGGLPIERDELRQFLSDKLPQHMVPRSFTILDEIPLTPNGKLDRLALPAPERESQASLEVLKTASTPTEELLVGIYEELLGLERVGVLDNFFNLGGHSLLATRLLSRVRQRFGVEVGLRKVFENPTVAALAAYIETLGVAANKKEAAPVTRLPHDGDIPLSFSQQRLWFLDRLELGRAAYNIPTAVHLTGDLDIAALERGLKEMVRRHESLRTAFLTADGQPRQAISKAVTMALAIDDLRGLRESEREAAARELMSQESGRPFDLTQAPLLRARLLRLSESEQLLVVVFHHIVSDGWSLGVFVRELCLLYEAYRRGEESPLAELPLQYADYAQWQRQRLSGARLEREVEYWRERLGGRLEPLALPTDRARRSVPHFGGKTHSFVLGTELTGRLKELSQQQDATLFMTLLAGMQTLLWRYTGQEDISVGTPVAGRIRTELEGLIGFFVNTLVLRTDLSGGPTFAQLVQRVKEVCLGAYQHQELPFEQLVEALQPEREVSRTPLFQVMLVLQNTPLPPIEMSGLTAKILHAESGTAKFELTLFLRETANGLDGIIEYQTDLFDADTIRRFSNHFIRLLESAAADPEKRICELELLSEEERRESLIDWNATRREYASDNECLHQLFEEQARRTPAAIAATYGDKQITFAELNRRANQLARLLRRRSVGLESRVGLLLERSIDLLVGALAVLKAGAAYVPLDPAYPPERLSYIVRDADASVLLTHGDLSKSTNPRHGISVNAIAEWGVREVIGADATGGWTTFTDLNHQEESGDKPLHSKEESDADLGIETSGNSLAYVIYTSGSTGKPKGVLGLHRGAVNRFRWMWENYPFQQDDVCCQKTSMSFVDFVWELFGPLLKGVRTLIIPDAIVSDPQRFIEALAGGDVTRLVLVPSLLTAMMDACDDLATRLPKLKLWVVSGEAFPSALAERFQRELPDSKVLNLYGSSEVSADVTGCEVNAQASLAVNSIGRPIANTQIYLLDSHLQPVPPVAWGELYAAGAGLARGYCNRPDLTAERFVPNPFSEEPGARMYRTGDLARRLSDGNIEFRGRADQQIKLRGFRIEPGEVESALVEHPDIHQALVMLGEKTPGEKHLLACLVLRTPGLPTTSENLRRHLRARLPEYMIPSEFRLFDFFPLTPSGKVDRQAMHVAPASRIGTESVYVAPQTEVERTIVSILQEILQVDRIGSNDNFFDLGGHSLLLVKLQSKLQKTFKRDVSLVQLFEYPTAGALTKYFSNSEDEHFSVRDVQDRLDRQWEALNRSRQSMLERKQG